MTTEWCTDTVQNLCQIVFLTCEKLLEIVLKVITNVAEAHIMSFS